MFKKFNANEDVAGRQNVKSSIQRAIRSKIIETFPLLEPHMEEIIPKKSQLSLIKWYNLHVETLLIASREHISLLALNNDVLFFQHFDEVYVPSLRLVHQCNIPMANVSH
jgi:PUA domain protein